MFVTTNKGIIYPAICIYLKNAVLNRPCCGKYSFFNPNQIPIMLTLTIQLW